MEAGQHWANYFSSESLNESELQRAVRQYSAAEKAFLQAEMPRYAEHALYKKSEAFHFLGLYEKQANTLEALLTIRELQHKLRTQAHIDLASHALYESRSFPEARIHIQHALSDPTIFDRPLQYADALETSVAIDIEEANFYPAIEGFKKTYDIYLTQAAKKDAINTALNLGYFYFRVGKVLKASLEYNSAKLLAESIQDNYSITNSNIKLATIYRNLGDFDKALNYLDSALETSPNFPHSYLDAWAKLEKAKVLKATLQYHYAMDWFTQSQKAFLKINVLADARQIDTLLASMYLDMKKLKEAEKLLVGYLEYSKTAQTPLQVAEAEAQLANMYARQKKVKEAAILQTKALKYFQNTSDPFAKANIQLDLAASLAALGELDKAQSYYHDARDSYKSIEATPNSIFRIYQFSKNLSTYSSGQALKIVDKALMDALSTYKKIVREDLSTGFLATIQDLVSLKLQLDENMSVQSRIVLAERVKAKTLKRHIMSHSSSESNERTQEIRLREINVQISQHLAALQNIDSAGQEAIIKQLRTFSEERYKIEQKLYFKSEVDRQIFEFGEIELQAFQNKLTEKQIVLFVNTGEKSTLLWYVTKNDIKQYRTAGRYYLEKSVSDFLSDLKNAKPESAILTLSQDLVANIFPDPTILEGKQELIVIPDGPLANLPFSTLINPLNQKPFIDSIDISFHHSLALLSYQIDLPRQTDLHDETLIIAAPEMLTEPVESDTFVGYQAANLPFSRAEAMSIKNTPGHTAQTLIGERASKHQLLRQNLAEFNVIHFATHAIANSDLPDLGGLILSNGHDSDNLLLAPDIKLLNLKARLVVLSGCETTVGQTIAGEGMLGLSRAFMQAGARNVLGSLWRVQDDATAKLMGFFYHYLLVEKLSPQMSLTNAQRKIREYKRKDGRRPWRAPYYWAGFVIHGTSL
ncbi:MAG: hypothetical protein Alis3KO_05270 [Aliiglaciecola sp.]